MKAAHDEALATVYCDKCNRYCYNQECLANHKEVCTKIYKCQTCNKVLERVMKRWKEAKGGYAVVASVHQVH